MVKVEHVTVDGTKVVFREPTPDDKRQLMSFINSFMGERKSGLMMNKKVTLKGEEEWLRGRLSEIRARKTFILLAELDGRIVGSCHITRLDYKHSHRASVGIALRKEFRGRGLGEALMRKTIELGLKRIKGIEFVDLSTFAYNERAQSLYRKLGFKEYGRIPMSLKEEGVHFDELLMRLEVCPDRPRGKARARRR